MRQSNEGRMYAFQSGYNPSKGGIAGSMGTLPPLGGAVPRALPSTSGSATSDSSFKSTLTNSQSLVQKSGTPKGYEKIQETN